MGAQLALEGFFVSKLAKHTSTSFYILLDLSAVIVMSLFAHYMLVQRAGNPFVSPLVTLKLV